MSDQWTSWSTPVDDVRRLEPEVLAHLRVERLRQIAGVDRSREHLPLELEAQDDVQAST